MLKVLRKSVLCMAGFWGLAVQAVPVLTPLTVDFEDLAFSGYATQPGAGYQGFNWGNGIYVQCGEAGGTDCGSVGAAANQYASTAGQFSSRYIGRTDGAGFYFDGGDFWSRRGADAVGDFYFILYGQNGQAVYQGNDKDLTGTGKEEKMVFTNEHTWMAPSYSDLIFGLSFIFDNDDYDHFAFDNLAFRALVAPLVDTGLILTEGAVTPAEGTATGNTVSEPGTMALVATGLLVAAWMRRRRMV